MTRFRVILTRVGMFSPVPKGASVDVWSSNDDKPSSDEVRQAFIEKYGESPSGLPVEWEYKSY